MRFRLSGAIFIFFVAGLAVPIHVALLPLFVLEKNMGLLGTLWALLPPYVAFGIPFQVFVLRGFMRLIPSELIEAARVDGAHDLVIFARVMIPLITPALATLFIIDAVATWNEFLIALVMLPSADVHTLPLGLLNFFNQFTGSYTQLSAGLVIGVIPLLILYVFLQRYLVSGLVGGAIKG
jgi:raffinose/stachyose/melibiose transport system permease protein